MTIDRRSVLRLAGAASLTMAMHGAVRAEGGPSPATAAIPFAHRTPIRMGAVALRVRNLSTTTSFYRSALGLEVVDRSSVSTVLGAGGVPLLHLLARPDARAARRDEAGLYHTAFLMPSRADLGRWLVHAARNRVDLTGFADHTVSEAVYLDDPEGNGIEVYADRPAETWVWKDGSVTMGTSELDVDGLLALARAVGDDFDAVPGGTRIGHVHLKVGAVRPGLEFYGDALGLSSTRKERADAAFLSSGGYHHHVAINAWDSPGATERDPSASGLEFLSLEVRDADVLSAQQFRLVRPGSVPTLVEGGIEATDPWGTKVRLLRI
jgi:catechol 2,3-dioxygenase